MTLFFLTNSSSDLALVVRTLSIEGKVMHELCRFGATFFPMLSRSLGQILCFLALVDP